MIAFDCLSRKVSKVSYCMHERTIQRCLLSTSRGARRRRESAGPSAVSTFARHVQSLSSRPCPPSSSWPAAPACDGAAHRSGGGGGRVASADCQSAPSSAAGPKGLRTLHPPTVCTKKHSPFDNPRLTLEYFALRGLGELPRLILEATDTPYNAVFHFSWPGDGMPGSWKKYVPFGQLPVLRDGDLMIAESGAICRHLARKCCIDGTTLEDKARVDMYFELAKDIKAKKALLHDPEHKDWAKLASFLRAGEDACDGKFFVGGALTLADVAMFEALYTFEELKPGCLGAYLNSPRS